MEPATSVPQAVQAAQAISGLRAGLAASGITGTYACDAGGMAMLGCPRATGGLSADLVIWSNGDWFWWRTDRVARGRKVLTVHSAADPDGAARRLRKLSLREESDVPNGTSRDRRTVPAGPLGRGMGHA